MIRLKQDYSRYRLPVPRGSEKRKVTRIGVVVDVPDAEKTFEVSNWCPWLPLFGFCSPVRFSLCTTL